MSLLSVIARLPGGAHDIGARWETSTPFGVVVVVERSLEVGVVVLRQEALHTGAGGGLLAELRPMAGVAETRS
jgi:hypothetical protein